MPPTIITSPRERILRESEHLIHLQGFRCTSLEDIASRCGMTKANLLHHFKSKEELGLAVLDYKIDCYRRNCLDPLFSGEPDPGDAVTKLFDMASCFHRQNGCKAGCFIANIALEMSDASERFRGRAGRFFEEWASRIEDLLRRHQTQGHLKHSLDCRTCAEAILSLYEGAVMLARTRRDPRVFDRVGQVARELVESHRTLRTRPKTLSIPSNLTRR